MATKDNDGNDVPRSNTEQSVNQTEWLRVALSSIGDAVISTDAQGRITFMNGVAETLTGWSKSQAAGIPLPDVFRIVNEHTRHEVENPALRALREGTIVGLANHTVLIARDGAERPIDDSASPMRDEEGKTLGSILVFRDVTERKRSEETQARLAAIVESSDDAIVSKSLDGTIRTWNGGAERIFGYSAEEAVGKPITLIVPRDRLDEERRILEQLVEGHRVDHFETIRVAKDGRRLNVSLTVSPLRDSDGAIIGAAKVARDITERKRIADERERLTETLQLAVEAADLGTWAWDPATDLTELSAKAAEIYGLAPFQTYHREWMRSLIHPDHRARAREAAERATAEHSEYDVEYPLDRSMPTWVSVRGRGIYDSDGMMTRMIGVVQDVSARKQAEAEALERERAQALLLRQVADAALTIHSSGSLESVLQVIGEEARRILGAVQVTTTLKASDEHVQTVNSVSISESAERWRSQAISPVITSLCEDVCATNRPMRMMNIELERHLVGQACEGAGHDLLPRCWIAAPFISRAGKNLGLIYAIDNVEGKFSENDEAILAQLAHIASVAIENARLYGELREQDRRKDEFLAVLAHELRNPLAPLRSGLEVLRRAGGDAKIAAETREVMDRQMSHMVRLVDDLLDISRITRNKMELRRSNVLLADAVNSAIEISRPMIQEAEHELIVSLPSDPIYLDADLTRLAQVFGNLLTNSAKYTERRGRISVSAVRTSDQVTVTVQDNGIGIPAYALSGIFDMFSQVDRSLEKSSGGMGIGLALVKGLVEMHGGTVEASSPGRGLGSTFTVRLPALFDEKETRLAIPSESSPELRGLTRRILVVDDNRDAAATLAMILKLSNNDVRVANDGVEAIEIAESFRPQVILMDIGMPRLNGYEATRRIREQPWGDSIIIIALTGWGQEVDKKLSREAGCDGHLVKPVKPSDLERLFSAGVPRRMQ